MYDVRNLIYIFTMLECIEKTWIYTKEFDDPTEDLNGLIEVEKFW